MSVIDTLIYDRTEADVKHVQELKQKILTGGLTALSAEEKAEYMAGMKGAYNATDLNRVGEAVAYLAERMTALADDLAAYRAERWVANAPDLDVPYNPEDIAISPKTDWSVEDVPTVVTAEVFIQNLKTLHDAVSFEGLPAAPESLNGLTYQTANAIEQMLYMLDQGLTQMEADIKARIDRAAQSVVFAGTVYSGE